MVKVGEVCLERSMTGSRSRLRIFLDSCQVAPDDEIRPVFAPDPLLLRSCSSGNRPAVGHRDSTLVGVLRQRLFRRLDVRRGHLLQQVRRQQVHDGGAVVLVDIVTRVVLRSWV